MKHPEGLAQWREESTKGVPVLSKAQAGLLAQWCFALEDTGACGCTRLAVFLALALGCRCDRLRRRRREWYVDATDTPGLARREVEVRACFAPLAPWVRAHWPDQRVALALDARSVGARLPILAVSVGHTGCAVPLAWKILRANRKRAWKPEWLALLDLVAPARPADWGLQARWLFRASTGHHGQCVNTQGTFHARRQRLADFAPRVGRGFAGGGVACTGSDRRLVCTLLACWEEGYAAPWGILTDLAPGACNSAWYALRSWIEQNFRLNKRGFWQWQQTRMTDPARAERVWLPLALCPFKLLAVGDAIEQDERRSLWGRAVPTLLRRRPTRLVCLGWLARRAAQATGRPVPRLQPLSPDAWPDWPLPAAMLAPCPKAVA